MPNYRRARVAGGTYFFTVVTYRRHPVFHQEPAIRLLEQSFSLVGAEYPFILEAMVILPDHLHCIWTLPDGDADFSGRWRRIKARFSRKYVRSGHPPLPVSMQKKGEKAIWQRRFWEHTIRDEEEFCRYCDYIHYNPVKHGLAASPIEWSHSSFRRFVENGSYDVDWGHEMPLRIRGMDLE